MMTGHTDRCTTLVPFLVSLKLDHCNSVLAGLSDIDIHKLQSMKNAAACLAMRVKKYEHISPTLRQSDWLPVRYHITQKIMVLVYKALDDQAPPYIKVPLLALISLTSPNI